MIAPTAPAVSRFWIFWRKAHVPRPTSAIRPLSDPAGGAAQPIGSPTFAISPNVPVIVTVGIGPVPNCPRKEPSPLTVQLLPKGCEFVVGATAIAFCGSAGEK